MNKVRYGRNNCAARDVFYGPAGGKARKIKIKKLKSVSA